jgi:tetratricopeptide (TPR) repeat protein
LWFGILLRSQGDFVAAERALDTAIRLSPRGLFHRLAAAYRIDLLIDRGDIENAKAAFEPLWAEYRYSDPARFSLVLGRLGHETEATELAAQLARDPTANPYDVFHAYYALGNYDEALVWMRRTIDDRGAHVAFLRLPNLYPGLQEQPGYADALKYFDSLQKSR